jgi:hypothetical protein
MRLVIISVLILIIIFVCGFMLCYTNALTKRLPTLASTSVAHTCNCAILSNHDVFLFRTHIWNDYIDRVYKDMLHDLPTSTLYILFDKTSGNIPEQVQAYACQGQVIFIDQNQCHAINPLDQGPWFTVDSSLVLAYNYLSHHHNKEYNYLWLIEFDVRHTGKSWTEMLQNSVKHCYSADFVAAYVFSFLEIPWWIGWMQLLRIWNHCIWFNRNAPSLFEMWKGFLPISRYSRRLLQRYKDTIGQWSTYCEIYLPSQCIHSSRARITILNNPVFRYTIRLYHREFKSRHVESNIIYGYRCHFK